MKDNNSNKIISGEAKISENRKDSKTIFSYIKDEYIVPAIKKTISTVIGNGSDLIGDVIKNSVDMAMYGEAGVTKKNNSYYSGPRVSYINYNTRREPPRLMSANTGIDYQTIIFNTRGDADIVMDKLYEELEDYGEVRLAALYEYAGITCPPTYNNYGWKNLKGTQIVRMSDGGYTIDLPKPHPMDLR